MTVERAARRNRDEDGGGGLVEGSTDLRPGRLGRGVHTILPTVLWSKKVSVQRGIGRRRAWV